MGLDGQTALNKLIEANKDFVEAKANTGDISDALRKDLSSKGQFPFAIVVSCSDSRVVPEHIFMCGLGDIFTVRVAGNVVDTDELASCIYAAEHLGCKLILVLGHTQCGAIQAAIEGGAHGPLGELVKKIEQVINGEKDAACASKLNVLAGIKRLKSDPDISELEQSQGLLVKGALYHLESGRVEVFD